MRKLCRLALLAVLALAALLALRRIDDFDTWWHLAAGRFIVTHGTIPATDVLSHTARDRPWINLQWAFDVALYLLHELGGARLLTFSALLCFSLAVGLVLRLARPSLGDGGAALLGLPVVLVAQDRFAVRPEMLSFLLLALLLTVLERARRRDGRGLWLLPVLMVLWANVHALFVVGSFAIVCTLAGALAARVSWLPTSLREASRWDGASSRRLVVWGGVALVAPVLNPFGITGLLFPATLLARIGKLNPAFRAIAEFQSPFAPDVQGIAIDVYKLLLIGGLALTLFALVVSLRRSGLDLGALVFCSGLGVLSILVRRNMALFALGATPFLAHAAGTSLHALPPWLRARARPRAPLGAAALTGALLVLAGLVVSGTFYRFDGAEHEFGGGMRDGTFPVRAVGAIRETGLPPALYNDIAAGSYLAWDDPIGGGVFIDGRLEVYAPSFVASYVAAMYDQQRWDAEAERLGVETVVLFHHWENRRLLVERLARTSAWSLVYADEVVAVFVRTRGNEQAIARAGAMRERWNEATRVWLERAIPRWGYPAGRIQGTRAFARLLATLGDAEGAAVVFTRLIELGIPRGEEVDVRLRLARLYLGTGRADRARGELGRILEIDPVNGEARSLLGTVP